MAQKVCNLYVIMPDINLTSLIVKVFWSVFYTLMVILKYESFSAKLTNSEVIKVKMIAP